MTMTIPDYPVDTDILIAAQGTWPSSVHLFKRETVAALRAAEATGRPLLIRGLPGVGKSETARAAAAFAKRPFLSLVIDGRTEPDDLKWRVDAVKRLSDAQTGKTKKESAYVRPEVLWWALDWAGAQSQSQRGGCRAPDVVVPSGWQPGRDRAVLLLDEIDKADPDLPNALLEVLANRGFTPPFAGLGAVCCDESAKPLIIITTNEERELPPAFLRRCLVLKLELPPDDVLPAELIRLAQRHQRHRGGGQCVILDEVAEAFMVLRKATRAGEYLPATSEFLDLVQALATLCPDDAQAQREQLQWLRKFVWKSLNPLPAGKDATAHKASAA